MSFQPYQCLHIPVQTVGALRHWPAWIVLGGFALALYTWGMMIFIVPTACMVTVMITRFAVQRLAADDPLDWDEKPVAAVDVQVYVEPCSALGGRCLRCGARQAEVVAVALGQRIPLCTVCQVFGVEQIHRAAIAAIERGTA